MKKLLIIAALATCATGCYKTSIVNGDGGYPAATHDLRWYHGFVVGFVDVSGPIDLEQVCAGGRWTRIEVQTTFLNGLVQALFAYAIYTPQTVTIYCAGGAAYDTVLGDDGKVVYLQQHPES